MFGQSLGACRGHILFADFFEKRVLGQKRCGGKGRQDQSCYGQNHVPEIIADLSPYRHLRKVRRGETTKWEPVEERTTGKQHDQQDGEQEARNSIADNDDGAGPCVEAGAFLDRLANAKRDRDQIGQEGEPKTK
ncbi:hypothetical protein D3C80_1672460 [compost metagenome]